jgi:hypothetical protein
LNVPEALGVPLMVIVLDAHAAEMPAGKPVAVPMPVAPVVVCVILVRAVLTQSVGADDAPPTVLFAVTVIVTPFDVAGEPVKHGVAFDVITQVTAALFVNVVEVYVVELDPTLVPFTFHWYEGVVPPLVGVAVKVTEVPEQMVVAVAAIETLAVRVGLTFTSMVSLDSQPAEEVAVAV